MTVIYRPVLIETTEQAEALPEEALILRTHDDPSEGTWCHAQGAPFPASWLPVLALVPTEADEEVYGETKVVAWGKEGPAGFKPTRITYTVPA